jgi:hypothetical protein
MLKIKFQDNTTYAEVGQVNPLRWKTLWKQPDGAFVDQSGWIKCKDFYNDTVAYFKEGSVFSIYGYKNAIQKNEEGVYFLLKFIKDKASFFKNMDAVNEQLVSDLGCRVQVLDMDADDEVVVCIPLELWESTYRISMITMVVRLCNYGVLYKTWDDIWAEKSPVNTVEHAFTPDAKKNAKTLGFLVPDKFKDFWYFAGPEFNSKKAPRPPQDVIIHNNGVSNWSEFMKQGALA